MKNKTVKSFLVLGVLLLTLTNANLLGGGTRTIDPPVGGKSISAPMTIDPPVGGKQSISMPRTIDPPVGNK